MAIDLAALLAPDRCAVVTQECQVGVIGKLAVLRDLADEAQREAARSAGVPVVHCLAVRRADDRGSNRNARLFAATRRLGIHLEPGTDGAALLPELGPDPADVVLQRFHGIGPM